mgnify:CR=1 FL=1
MIYFGTKYQMHKQRLEEENMNDPDLVNLVRSHSQLLEAIEYMAGQLKLNIKKIIFIFFVTAITISPYLVRNYIAFDKIIVHSGFGYNLWKAYNINANVEGFYIESTSLKSKIEKVKKDTYYRINEDKLYLESAKEFILENPGKSLKLFIKRFFSFFFIDLNSSQENYLTKLLKTSEPIRKQQQYFVGQNRTNNEA